MTAIARLSFAAYGIHFADQMTLVAVPLVAAVAFMAGPDLIGVLVACQSLAHLLGSLPFGILVDRMEGRRLALVAAALTFIGLAAASIALLVADFLAFAVAVTWTGFGVVLFLLVALSILPRLAEADGLASANARIEVPRALASLLMPLSVGLLFASLSAWSLFAAAAVATLAAGVLLYGLPEFRPLPQRREAIWVSVAKGGSFVLRHALLLPILLCALFWNLAFAALLVVLVPLIVETYVADPGNFGLALAAFGLGAVIGTWMMRRLASRIPPNSVLLFGPGSSAVALLGLTLAPSGSGVVALYPAFFLLGFGPAMWMVAQNAVRQLVTPDGQLGRVNAVIQTVIYGIRPLGALAGGWMTAATSPETGLLIVAIGFLLSFAAALFSPLRSVRRYRDLRAPAL